VDLLGVKLTRPAAPYQFDGVLEGCRPVKSVPKGFTDQRVRRCMVPALTSMDICEQVTACQKLEQDCPTGMHAT
jgi:hypothetical protein